MPTSPVDYFKALIACGLVAFIYEQAFVPMIIHRPEVANPPPVAQRDTSDPSIQRFFPAGAWQRNNPRQIRTELGVLLFKDWQRISDNRWRLSPVTLMLSGSKGKPDEGSSGVKMSRPVMLNADQGAEIEFAESLHVIDGSTPPVKEGHLIGRVHIVAEATKPDGSDGFEINTSDVLINGKKIWTTGDVRVRFGQAEAIGRDLTINLAGNGTLPTRRDDSPLAILNDLSLIYLQRLTIPLETPSLWPPLPEVSARAQAAAGASATNGKAIVNVNCRGGLRFDFATYSLTLSQQVTIAHQGAGLPIDSLQCNTLEIGLENPFGNSVESPQPQQMIRRIKAEGSPLQFKVPTLLAEAKAEVIDADLRRGLLRIGGAKGIDVLHRGMQLLMSDLEYRFRPGQPTELIHLRSDGTGKLIAHDAALPMKSFTWTERLWVTPQPTPDRYQLYLRKASAILPDDGRIQTDSLVLAFAMSPEGTSKTESSLGSGIQAEKLVAEGNVVFDTKEIFAETNRLDVFIEQLTPQATEQQRLRLTQADGGSMRLWTREPDGKSGSQAFGVGLLGNSDVANTEAASRPRPRVSGGSLSVSILTDGENAIADGFQISQSVRIDHVLDSEIGPMPMVLVGSQVTFADDEKGRRIVLAGTPAEVKVDDGHFRGPVVQLNIDENFVFMNQPGEFRMPKSMLTSVQPAGDASGPARYRWLEPPRCTWGKQAFFNGKTATLLGDVSMTGSIAMLDEPARWNLNVLSDQVQLEMAQRINFNQPQSASQSDVKRLTFQGMPDRPQPVNIAAVEYDELGKLVGRHEMQVPELNLMPQTGELTGAGPGWYHMWSQPDADSNSPISALASNGNWLAAHLVYEEAIQGNLNQKVLSFLRGVRIATSPTLSDQVRIDARQISDPMQDQAVLTCDQLRLSQTPKSHQFHSQASRFGAWEAQAMSNVTFRGRNDKGLFTGLAHRVSYAANKDLFVIVGDGNRPARFQRFYTNGQPGPSLDAFEIEFKPTTFEVQNVRLSGSSSGNLEQLRANMQNGRGNTSPGRSYPQPNPLPSQAPAIRRPPVQPQSAQQQAFPFRSIPQAQSPAPRIR